MTPVTKWPAWALATLLLAVLCTQQPAKAELRQDDTAVVIAAVVNDDVITEYDVIARMRLVMLSARIPDTPENRERLLPQVLRSLIDERLQIQEAQRLEISVEKDELEAAIRRIEEANVVRGATGAERLQFGVGLHYGSFMFGNIGTLERLEFTAVGAAVNEAARLEALTKELELPVVASETFASLAEESWTDQGLHRLRGVVQERRVFTLSVR